MGMLKQIIRTWKKDFGTSKESWYLMYWDASNLYRWEMLQKFPINGFKWKKEIIRFEKDFINFFDKDSNKVHLRSWYQVH